MNEKNQKGYVPKFDEDEDEDGDHLSDIDDAQSLMREKAEDKNIIPQT